MVCSCGGCIYSYDTSTEMMADIHTRGWYCNNIGFRNNHQERNSKNVYGDYYVLGREVRPVIGGPCEYFNNGKIKIPMIQLSEKDLML